MNITRKTVIRDETWRAQEGPLRVDLELHVHVGNLVSLPHDTMKAILEKAGFTMVEAETRFPHAAGGSR